MIGKVISANKISNVHPIYKVTKESKYGTYTGIVSPCEEDLEVLSDLLGYRLAEMKCDIKIQHRKAMNMKERYIGAKTMYNVLKEQILDKDLLERRVEVLEKEYKQEYQKYKNMKERYHTYAVEEINLRREVIKKHDERKQKQ
jgi:hypothetical protein